MGERRGIFRGNLVSRVETWFHKLDVEATNGANSHSNHHLLPTKLPPCPIGPSQESELVLVVLMTESSFLHGTLRNTSAHLRFSWGNRLQIRAWE